MKRSIALGASLAAMAICSACTTTSVAPNFNGLETPDGKPIAHISTSNVALHLLLTEPIVGDATLDGTVDDFTAAAKDQKATKVRIVQSSVTAWWFLFPPFTFVLTPVTSNVAGDILP